MLRLMRQSTDTQAHEIVPSLAKLESFLLGLNVPQEVRALVAFIQQDHDHNNYGTFFSGAPTLLEVKEGVPQFYTNQLAAAKNYQIRVQILLDALLPHLNLSPTGELNVAAQESISVPNLLYSLISSPEYVFVVNNCDPVIIPYFSQDFYHQQICNHSLNYQRPLHIVGLMLATALGTLPEEPQEATSNLAQSHPNTSLSQIKQNEVQEPSLNLNQNNTQGQLSPDILNDENFSIDQETASLDSKDTTAQLNLNAAAKDPDKELSNISAPSSQEQGNEAKTTAAAVSGGAGAGAIAGGMSRLSGCLLPALLLLLLIGALVFYFMKWYPWPFGSNEPTKSQIEMLNEQLVDDEANLDAINNLIAQTQDKLDTAYDHNHSAQLELLKETLEQNKQTLGTIERLMGLLEAKELQIRQAQEESLQKQAQAQEQAAKPPKVNNVATLPKCETIIKQGKMPNLIIATDGSGSMIQNLPDNTMRIEAAIQAANALVDSVDKNVPIRLLGMQGCPLARDYGTFGAKQRGALKSAINQTSPFKVRGMLPIEVTTPLVSALKGMASAAPDNVPAIGVLISDGVDTCRYTEDLDLCSVAREIHKSKPKLTINVVLIGEDAPNAKCVADITGGHVYYPNNTSELIKNLKSAGKSLYKVCH